MYIQPAHTTDKKIDSIYAIQMHVSLHGSMCTDKQIQEPFFRLKNCYSNESQQQEKKAGFTHRVSC